MNDAAALELESRLPCAAETPAPAAWYALWTRSHCEHLVPDQPYIYLREGQRVRITRGPLAEAEGILVRTKPNRGLLVVSVNLLQRSVATHVDCTWVEPA